MLIASKYEEMYAPEIRDFVYITDNTYTSEEIRAMERNMLKVLDYSFGNPLCLHFLRRNSRAGDVSMGQSCSHYYVIFTVARQLLRCTRWQSFLWKFVCLTTPC